MRVVLLVTDLELGGSPLRLARLSVGLRAAGVDVHVGCLARAGPVSTRLADQGIATFACDAAGRHDLGAIRRLVGHLRRIEPDLIHATLTHANVAARLAGEWCGIPVIGSTATIEVERRWHRWAERATAWMDAAHLVGSHAVANHVTRTFRIAPERVVVIPPSVSAPERTDRASARLRWKIPSDAFVWGWTGRMDPVKRVDWIIAAMGCLPGSHLLLAGDGPERPRLEALAQANAAITPRVHFIGWQTDVGAVLSAADAFVFPSRTEGMPNALLEAMAYGLPCLASDVAVHRELAGADGDEPLRIRLVPLDRVPPSGAVTRLAAAMEKLQSHPGDAQRVAQAAAAWARAQAPPEASIRAVKETYHRVLSDRGN